MFSRLNNESQKLLCLLFLLLYLLRYLKPLYMPFQVADPRSIVADRTCLGHAFAAVSSQRGSRRRMTRLLLPNLKFDFTSTRKLLAKMWSEARLLGMTVAGIKQHGMLDGHGGTHEPSFPAGNSPELALDMRIWYHLAILSPEF